MVTIKDIAARAGVSVPTVSCALRDAPNVSATVKRRIRKLADQMGYVPNRLARAMTGASTRTIAIAFPGWRWFETETNRQQMESFGRLLDELNYLLCLVRFPPGELLPKLRAVYASNRIDGAVLQTTELTEQELAEIQALPFPCVLLNSRIGRPELSGTFLDEENGGWLAGRHLTEMGHTRVGVLGPLDMPHYGTLRTQGFQRALRERFGNSTGGLACEELRTSKFLCEDVEVTALVKRAHSLSLTGIFCLSDRLAWQVYRAAHGLGIVIPAELSVIGFDDAEIGRVLSPGLTTIKCPGAEIGKAAATQLIGLIADRTGAPRNVILQPSLHVRHSVALR